jgi:hypothetical protein
LDSFHAHVRALGSLLHHIRTVHNAPSDKLHAYLNAHGFLYSFRDLAKHMARRRGVSAADLRSIPAEELAEDFSALQRALQKLQDQPRLRSWCALSTAELRERFARDLQGHQE